ncbi:MULTISPECIES: hypothetical protein [Proteiniphilum]|uniref:hypothetical protein n=1 Tax=Proteiniphilum TaxID=294702 RepID=UPI001EECC2E3|nr:MULTISPECIES: hypothetical protein [Proteiniphilum]ULB34946.1 hypothetical protein KDN43_02510 [Proteiniphilum propionicum]
MRREIMKNKKITTSLLLMASIIIWGSIARRVSKAIRKEDAPIEKSQPRTFVNKPDSAVLLLNYDDPFLKKPSRNLLQTGEEPKVDQDNQATNFLPAEPDVVQGPAFKFKGILKAGKITYGLLDFEGETMMARTREKIGDFYIVHITADKLVVRRQGLDMELFAE